MRVFWAIPWSRVINIIHQHPLPLSLSTAIGPAHERLTPTNGDSLNPATIAAMMYFGGVLFLCLCTTTFVFFPIVLVICLPTLFSLLVMFCVPIPLFTYAPGFPFAHLCVFSPHLDEKLLGVCAYAFYHMQPYVDFEICLLNILYYI